MQLNRRQTQFLCDLGVLNLAGILQRQTLDTFCHIRARGNGTPAAECLKLDIGDYALLINTNLEFHDISASGRQESVSVPKLEDEQ
jgi:hypothetical protein